MSLSHVVVLTKAHTLVVCRQCLFFTATARSLSVLQLFQFTGLSLPVHAVTFCFGDTRFCKFVLTLFILVPGL